MYKIGIMAIADLFYSQVEKPEVVSKAILEFIRK